MRPEIYRKLAATGRYYNTGKVLIGLQYTPPRRHVTSKDEDRLQRTLLNQRVYPLKYDITVYTLYMIGVVMLVWAVLEALK